MSVVRLAGRVGEGIGAHAAAAYPEECCGGLLGRADRAGGLEVCRAAPVENGWPGERGAHYRIGAETVRALETLAAREGVELVGFYHSHPDAAAEPSPFDLELAWPWYAYLIVPVGRGRAGEARGWRLREDRGGFDELTLRIASTEEVRCR